MTQCTASYAAFHELVDLLRDTADSWLSADNEVETPRDFAEGIRNVLHLLSGGIDFYLEGDPERPEFVKIVSPIRRFMGDNPDAIYHFARIRDDRSYRIVLAAVDPGVPNWLCTEGRPEGTMFWRFLLPDGAPEKPLCRVVQIKDLKVTAR